MENKDFASRIFGILNIVEITLKWDLRTLLAHALVYSFVDYIQVLVHPKHIVGFEDEIVNKTK